MSKTSFGDMYKMEKQEIAFYEISCGVPSDNFDLIINCNSAIEIWEMQKNIYKGTEQAQDKKQTIALNDFNNSKSLLSENHDESFKRFNLIITKVSNSGTIRRNYESNL